MHIHSESADCTRIRLQTIRQPPMMHLCLEYEGCKKTMAQIIKEHMMLNICWVQNELEKVGHSHLP